MIYFPKSNVAHLGDHFFNGVFPFVDLTTGGNAFKLTENIKTIIDSLPEDALIIPGHGQLTDIPGLKTYYKMLTSSTSFVKNKADAGKTLEEIQQAGLPEEWASWGGGFINEANWIQSIYHSLPK